MSPDEVGFLISQTPDHEVEFSRSANSGFGGPAQQLENISEDVPDKVFRATPGVGGSVSFKLDYELNGIGGQPPTGEVGTVGVGPMEVTAQHGEVIVIKEILKDSIPLLTGWKTMMDVNTERMLSEVMSGRGGASGSGVGVPF